MKILPNGCPWCKVRLPLNEKFFTQHFQGRHLVKEKDERIAGTTERPQADVSVVARVRVFKKKVSQAGSANGAVDHLPSGHEETTV